MLFLSILLSIIDSSFLTNLNSTGKVCSLNNQTYLLKKDLNNYFTFFYKEQIPLLLNINGNEVINAEKHPILFNGKLQEDILLKYEYPNTSTENAELCIYYTNLTNPDFCDVSYIINNPSKPIHFDKNKKKQCFWFIEDLRSDLKFNLDEKFDGVIEVYQDGVSKGVYTRQNLINKALPIGNTFVRYFEGEYTGDSYLYIDKKIYTNIGEDLVFKLTDFSKPYYPESRHFVAEANYYIKSGFNNFRVKYQELVNLVTIDKQTSVVLAEDDFYIYSNKTEFYSDSGLTNYIKVNITKKNKDIGSTSSNLYSFTWPDGCINKIFIKDLYKGYNINDYFMLKNSDLNNTCLAIYSSVKAQVNIKTHLGADVISDGIVNLDNTTADGYCTIIKFRNNDYPNITINADISNVKAYQTIEQRYNLSSYSTNTYVNYLESNWIYNKMRNSRNILDDGRSTSEIKINPDNNGIIRVRLSPKWVTQIFTYNYWYACKFQPGSGRAKMFHDNKVLKYTGNDIGGFVFALKPASTLDIFYLEETEKDVTLYTIDYIYTSYYFSTGQDLYYSTYTSDTTFRDFHFGTNIWYCLATEDDPDFALPIQTYKTDNVELKIDRFDNRKDNLYSNFVVSVSGRGVGAISFGQNTTQASDFTSFGYILWLIEYHQSVYLENKNRYVVIRNYSRSTEHLTFVKSKNDNLNIIFTSRCFIIPSDLDVKGNLFIGYSNKGSFGINSNKYLFASNRGYVSCSSPETTISLYFFFPDVDLYYQCQYMMYAIGSGKFNMVFETDTTVCGFFGGKITNLTIIPISKTIISIDGMETTEKHIEINDIQPDTLHSIIIRTRDNFLSVRASGEPLYIGYDRHPDKTFPELPPANIDKTPTINTQSYKPTTSSDRSAKMIITIIGLPSVPVILGVVVVGSILLSLLVYKVYKKYRRSIYFRRDNDSI